MVLLMCAWCYRVLNLYVAGALDRQEFVSAYALHKNAEASAFYDMVDTNQDGEIDRQEFLAACRSGGPLTMSKEEAGAFFKMADANGDGVLDVHEFVSAFSMHREALRFFMAADANGDGALDQAEFVASCASGMLPISVAYAKEFFMFVSQGASLITKAQFVSFYQLYYKSLAVDVFTTCDTDADGKAEPLLLFDLSSSLPPLASLLSPVSAHLPLLAGLPPLCLINLFPFLLDSVEALLADTPCLPGFSR